MSKFKVADVVRQKSTGVEYVIIMAPEDHLLIGMKPAYLYGHTGSDIKFARIKDDVEDGRFVLVESVGCVSP